MHIRFFAAVLLTIASLALTAGTQAAKPAGTLHYQWTPGQTLRYLIQRDPYFADPEGAVAAISPDVPYKPPTVERLTEQVQKIGPDGTATLALTLTAEPGFEDASTPQQPIRRTVTVTPTGHILSITGGTLGSSPAERDLLRGLPVLPPTAQKAAWMYALQPSLTERRTPGHDGILLQTTFAAQSGRIVFDRHTGSLARQDSTLTISSRLVMTQRGRHGVADFGRVVPHVQIIQTLTVERQDDLPL